MRAIKTIATCLLLIFAAIPGLLALFFLCRQQIIFSQMEERLEEQFLQTITLNKKDFLWIKQGKEIKTGGRLFDVKRFHETKDSICLIGLFDTQEDDLHRLLTNLVHSKQQSSPTETHLFSFIKMIYEASVFVTNTIAAPVDQASVQVAAYSILYPATLKEVIAPPPKV